MNVHPRGCQCDACHRIPNVLAQQGNAQLSHTVNLCQNAANNALPEQDEARKLLPLFTFLVEYFPDVIVALTELCVQGNVQHNKDLAPTDIKWAREKSADQMNTAFRHMFDRGRGNHFDSDGQRHIIKAVWRNMAQGQLDIEASRKVARK